MSKKFNKAMLSLEVHSIIGGTKVGAEGVVNQIFSSIATRLANGEQVLIAGFGNFKRVVRKARIARNPKNGQTVEVPKRFVVKFRPALSLKKTLNK